MGNLKKDNDKSKEKHTNKNEIQCNALNNAF